MNDIIKALFELSKMIAIETVTLDRIICNGPCYLFGHSIASDGGGEADALLYNGHSTNDPVFIHLDTLDEAAHQEMYFPPQYFNKGLYIDIGTNVAGVTVRYIPVKS